MSEERQILVGVTGDPQLAEEWQLVLLAQGLSPNLRQSPEGMVLSVPRDELERALASLSAYEQENPQKIAPRAEPSKPGSALAAAALAISLLVFFFVTAQWLPALSWLARGSADAQRIFQGELWRTVTALTLHADVAHVLSNAVAAGLFFTAVFSIVGAGFGGALILLAGAGGNLANAFLQGASHDSVGASTAVFGAVGLLGSLAMARRRRGFLSRRRAWLPLGAALALLGMLGSGGANVDIWAHLLGLVVGAALGLMVNLFWPSAMGVGGQWACGAGAVAMLVYCWVLAFR